MTEKYKFHTDPGHGWLQVSRAELERLEIHYLISQCSYESSDGKTAFLEEDCDAAKFWQAKKMVGEEFDTETRHVDYDHPIRRMKRFNETALCFRNRRMGA